ncbi:hypothetical protein PPH41_39400, partial [Burkholderia gladioli]|nr:hypothetical protein [Burkholderia gladioli]
ADTLLQVDQQQRRIGLESNDGLHGTSDDGTGFDSSLAPLLPRTKKTTLAPLFSRPTSTFITIRLLFLSISKSPPRRP